LQFQSHSSEGSAEDLIGQHELLVQKLRSYYEQNVYVIFICWSEQMLIACDCVTRIASVCAAPIHVSNVAQETIVKAAATSFNI